MKRDGHNENTVFFIGPEVEHTPAYSKKTLFVVGKPALEQIFRMANEYKTPHIFMGANHSFDIDPTDSTFYWDNTITALLDKGFWVTLDYQAHQHDKLLLILNKGIWQSRLFVPLLSVRIANLQTSSPNLTVKFDDVDFAATNNGVWCMHHAAVTDSNRFTDWQDYVTDTVVSPLSGPVPNPVLRVPVPTRSATYIDVGNISNEAVAGVIEDIKNLTEPGLDLTPTTSLKPEDAIVGTEIVFPVTPEAASEAYAEGATEDPLGKNTTPKKKVTGKK